MRLKFNQDYTPKAAGAKPFKKDQVVEFADDEQGRASAQHFLNRQLAVDLDAEEETKADEGKPARMKAAADVKKADEKPAQGLVPPNPAKG